MRERSNCVLCGSQHFTTISKGTFSSIRHFIEADPWGEDPLEHISDEPWCFVCCDDCGMKFHRFILSLEWSEIRFNKWMDQSSIEQFEKTHFKHNPARDHVQHILRLQKLVGSQPRLLDFGCGSGNFLKMAALFGFDTVGVDRSAARRKIAGFEIANDLNEIDGDFDIITMFEVLEHLDNPLDVLTQLIKRLRPTGIFVVEVPDCTGVSEISTEYAYRKIHPLEHINAFEPHTLIKMLQRVGLRPIAKLPAYVTTDPIRLGKDIGKAVTKQNTTQRYFKRATSATPIR